MDIEQIFKDLWRSMLDHPWITTLLSMIVTGGFATPLIVLFWICVAVDRGGRNRE